MFILLYGALIIAQLGTCVKAFSMKRCGQLTPGPFNSICINLARSLICIFVSLAIWMISDGQTTNTLGHGIIVVSGIGSALNLFAWILSANVVPLILIEAVSTVGSLVIPLLISPYLYGEGAITPIQWIGSLLICLSMLFFTNKDSTKKQDCSIFSKVLLLFLCAAGLTLTSIGKKYYTFNVSNAGLGSIEYFTLMNFVAVFLFFLLLFPLFYNIEKTKLSRNVDASEAQGRVQLPYKKVWRFILTAAVSLYVVELFATYASKLPSTIYYPVSRGLTLISFFLLDVIAYKDKVTVKKILGLVIILIGIVFVNL